jgi:hypothetical protein
MSIWVCEYCQIRDHKNDEIYTIAPLVPTRCVYCGSDAKYSVAAEKREHKTLWGLPLVEVNLLPALYGEWTTETPTVEGWYWFRVKSGTSESSITELSYIEIRGGRACFAPLVNGYEFDDDYEMSDITHWLGPIPAPEPPTE